MTKLVICLLFFGLLAIQTVGHMNSDPAPGRSPGPPPAQLRTIAAVTTSASSPTRTTAPAAVDFNRNLPHNYNRRHHHKRSHNEAVLEHDVTTHGGANDDDVDDNDVRNVDDGVDEDISADFREMEFELGKSQRIKLNEHINGGKADLVAAGAVMDGANEALLKQMLRSYEAATPTSTTETMSPLISNGGKSVPSATETAAAAVATNGKLHDKSHALNNTATTTTTTTTTTHTPTTSTTATAAIRADHSKSCREGLSEFLNDVVVIDEAEPPEATNDTEEQQQQQTGQTAPLHIQLELEHDVFDTTALGINCGLLYEVRLTTNPSSQSQPHNPAALLHYTGEFFIETVSTLNGRERGSFVGHSLGNKLPISWFSALHRNGKGRDDAGPVPVPVPLNLYGSGESTSSDVSDAVKTDFNTDLFSDEDKYALRNGYNSAAAAVAAADNFQQLQQQQKQQAEEAFTNKWLQGDETTRRVYREATNENTRKSSGSGNGNAKGCPDNKWQGSTKNHDNAPGTDSMNLWMVNELCEQDDTIEFRVFFRATVRGSGLDNANGNDNDANVGAQYAHEVVYRKTFKFKLRKDCQLLLKEASSGTLDYTTLPLYSIDCTVHFPSYHHLATVQTTTATPPPGILVELQRLNVPCSSGGYVRFNDHSGLCGKLEELREADRVHHFDVRRHTSVNFHKNPMFSIRYKRVDYCYNVTTSNQTGDYYIEPTRQDSLECFFRIHMPHGNRILLRLVTNNNSDILQMSTDSNDGGDAFPGTAFYTGESAHLIYTRSGETIEAQIVNLTLSGNSYMSTLRMRSPPGARVADKQMNASGNNSSPLRGKSKTGASKASGAGGTFTNIGLDSFAFLAASKVNMLGALSTANCDGVVVKVFESDFAKWSYCVNSSQSMRAFVLISSSNTLSIHLYKAAPIHTRFGYGASSHTRPADGSAASSVPNIYLSYEAEPVLEIVSNCAFGWIAMQQFCVSTFDSGMSWQDAEEYCVSLGGHLTSIRNDMHQKIINELLVHSPGYHEQNAYWVGGSDRSYEGDFRWSDGLVFQYTNWFAGWVQHGHYNRQPNDDGLSNQDCIELRRYFRTPPGIQTTRSPLTSSFMWNDRDCSAKNFPICERAMSDESLRRGWINDCNKTVSLTKEHPRASIWSPSFPRQYPDNANCFTTITAPTGYRIVIEFEELVIENEPGCTYDYLEITEPMPHNDNPKFFKTSKHKNANANANANDTNTNNTNKTFRKRSSYENSSLSPYISTSTSTSNSNSNTNANYNNRNFNSHLTNDNDNYLYSNNYNLAQINYQKLLHIFSNLYKPHTNFLIQTPDYPKGNPYYHHTNHMRSDDLLPKRLCGDWSSKLKLLRHVSASSYLGLHFVSDYSHHFSGYKAKTYMETRSPTWRAGSECSNERLRPYNGSCYLFVSYPEVDWWTAQQVCRGMGAKLTSVSSADEHRFITSNIRNQIDYSPQLIYWLGAELEKNGQFEWTDDSKMNFQGWLPGEGQFDALPRDATCLGLQWKMSPTPMLPSGLYWQAQKCNKIGGYVCKKPKESFGKYAFNNFTVTGTEGRLVSPTYPNTYPLNINYWININSPERTRIVVQFQKIDLEPQDECLYDFVSIQNYELISKITLEPGANMQPMAMLTSEELTARNDDNEMQAHSDNQLHYRRRRSIMPRKHIAASTARKRKRKRSAENEFHLMAQYASQMTYQHQPQAQHKNRNLVAARRDRKRSKKAVRRKNYYRHNASNDRSDTSDINENPKRRRRKKSKTEIENKLRGPFLSKNEGEMRRNVLPEVHTGQRQRQRRSTIVGDSPQAAPTADNAQSFLPYVRWCGSHDANMSKFDFVSSSNQVVLNFHSDYSVTGLGFAAVWKAIDVSGCPQQTLTSREGTVFSPNYPHFLLNNLNCAYVIQAPVGRRVWLEFTGFDFQSDAMLEVDIGNGLFRPFGMRRHLNEGIFVSTREQLRVQFKTGQHPRGKGFQAVYHTVGQLERRERVINFKNNATGYLLQLNYPHDMPGNVDFTQHLVAPFGNNILLELYGVEFSENKCPHNNLLEVYDNYADNNGTKWQLCKFQNAELYTGGRAVGSKLDHTEQIPYVYHQESLYNGFDAEKLSRQLQRSQYVLPPVYITSYLNTLYIRQRTSAITDANLNATVLIQLDNNYKMKLASGDKSVESCQPNPCQFNGKCVLNNGSNYCQCRGYYTGRFCGLNLCELDPCVFGKCELTASNFKCQCQPGYMGSTCEQKQRPCADNPCEGRGICFEKNGGYFCRCHAWWEGHRCERRMTHIPYKPLSERMLQEPFWLGLITVFVVLAAIGLIWCAKRHFPEKIEKLLAEEADRNRPPGSTQGHHHHTSLREQLQFTTAIPQTSANVAPGAPRSIFNRLGIRKPSLLSLSSPNPTSGGGGAAARTFSLDDLLRPPPRRSPSPRKKRNNSTPVKKNVADKKQILQQLISPAASQTKPKMSLDELISMSENRLRASNIDSESGDLKETTFSENSGSLASGSLSRTIADSKLEKKVTFARLLNKVSAEMSSGSEIEIGHMANKRNSSALSLPTDIQLRASSMPPSPCTNDIRSPHSTSSNQGSDSMSSSDLALNDFGLRMMQLSGTDTNGSSSYMGGFSLGVPARCRIGSGTRPKVSSADSILAMFRNFTVTAASNTTTTTVQSNSSAFISPLNTPTASSPQDDMGGDDDSSTSSMHTPVSFSSGPPDSPVYYRQTTIEVPVLDVLNAHKSSSGSSSASSSSANLLHPPTILLEIPNNGMNNKCLSPIREMPTPMPSPALTPIMPRPQRSSSPIFQEDPLSGGDYTDDDEKNDLSEHSEAQISEKIMLSIQKDRAHNIIDTDVGTAPTFRTITSMADSRKQWAAASNLPLLRVSPAPCSPTRNVLAPPMITIDVEPPTPEEKTPRPRDLIIPTLTVEQPSPTRNRQPMIIFPGSPPPQRASIGETSFMFPNKQQQKRLLKQFEKPISLDFPFVPPMITVTSNMSELESDTDPLSPAPKGGVAAGLMPPNPVGMCYLSPFTMCGRGDRTISESNLSSSGYSSMASPGPSRCGSSNPLCPNEMDEPGSGHSGAGFSLHANLMNRRKSSALPSCKENITNGKGSEAGNSASGSNTDHLRRQRHRSDSETFSDDILLESNDEGIGTDHVDEKLDDNRLGNFKELNMFMEDQVLIEVEEPPAVSAGATGGTNQMAQLQLPSIVIQIDGSEKGLSPVSSRSESPLSERAGMGRFSPHFYGRKDQLPFTDSDGLYDFPSSDGKGTSAQTFSHQRRSSSKKRERKSSKCSATQSPTKQQLEMPSKESLSTSTPSSSLHTCNKHCHSHHHPCPAVTITARKSPKRRPINRLPVASSSSSSESLTSAKELAVRPLPRRLNSPNREKRARKQESLSEDEVADALLRRISPSIVREDDVAKPKCKINRLRAIGNQIRFLRRLEKSIKTRERLASPTDSGPEENTDDMDSPQATSPLLQPQSPTKTRIALCRQKRVPGGTYGITAAALNSSNWKGTDRSLIGDDLNSD